MHSASHFRQRAEKCILCHFIYSLLLIYSLVFDVITRPICVGVA